MVSETYNQEVQVRTNCLYLIPITRYVMLKLSIEQLQDELSVFDFNHALCYVKIIYRAVTGIHHRRLPLTH